MNSRAICIAAFIAPALLAAAASADQLPHRKPGLWQITMQGSGSNMPAQVSKLCIDPKSEDALTNMGQSAAKKMCSQNVIRVAGGVATADSTCKIGPSVASSHTVTTFSGADAYHTETNIRYVPPLFGRTDTTMTQDGKWLGACPPDMQPGDMITPDGMKMHLGGTSPER